MRRFLAPCLLLAAAVPLGIEARARAEEPKMSDVQVGATPGAFALNDHQGQAARLGDGKGHGWFVLAFFPKAMTGG